MEWGGATVRLEDAYPVLPEAETPAEEPEEVVLPLPAGPLMWSVRLEDTGGGARAIPVARLDAGRPVSLDFPALAPDGYRERFDSVFAAPGLHLSLGSGGVRIGSIVLEGPSRVLAAGCPSVVQARVLVPPGTDVPLLMFAWEATSPAAIERPASAVIDNTVRTFGPILAERLLREGGEQRPYLAQRAELIAVPWPGDERPAMVATYLINDALDAEPPDGPAASLFFVARFEPASGYVPSWSEVRFYGGEGVREAFTWMDAWPGPAGRVDVAVRFDGVGRRLVASLADEGVERTIDWMEEPGCPSLELLEASP